MTDKKDWFVVILFIALLVAMFYPLLFQGKIFADSDMLSLFYPFFDFYHEAITSGESFLWNPLLFSGYPTYLSQSGGFFDPVNFLIYSFFDGVTGFHLRLFLNFFLVLLFSYCAGRAYGISRPASALIGAAYLISLYAGFLFNGVTANTLFLPPFLIFVFSKIEQGRRLWLWAALGGLGLGWAFLSGLAQLIVYSLTLLVVFAVFRFFTLEHGQKKISTALRWLGAFVVMLMVGVAVGLPQILPSLKFTSLTLREGGIEYAIAAGRSVEFGDFLLFLFPNYLYFPYISVGRKALYVGAFLFFAALAALVFIFKKCRPYFRGVVSDAERKQLRNVLPVAGVVVFTFLTALQWSPLFYLLHHLPVYNLFRYSDRWMFVGAFFLALLGAAGFDALRSAIRDGTLKKGLRRLGVITSVITSVITLGVVALNVLGGGFWERVAGFTHRLFSVFLYGGFGFTKDSTHYQDAIQRGIEAWREFLSFGDVSFLLPFLVFVVSAILFVVFLFERISWETFRAWGVAVSVAAVVAVFYNYWSYHMIAYSELEPHKNLIEEVVSTEDQALYRTYPFMLGAGFREVARPVYRLSREDNLAFTEVKFASGWPNIHFYSSRGAMASVDGYDPFLPRAYFDVLEDIGSTFGGQYGTSRLSEQEKIDRLLGNLDVIGMMGGKYIVSGVLLEHEALRLVKTAVVSRYKVPIYFYENASALPKFYFAEDGSLPGTDTLELKTVKNGFWEFSVDVSRERTLILSESNLPGWIAEVDEIAVSVDRANGLYMSVRIPEGAHQVTFLYRGILGEYAVLERLGIIRQ